MKKAITFTVLLLLSSFSNAYESSDFVSITQIRSGTGGNAYFDVDTAAAMCGTSTFLIKVIDDGSKAVYSTLLSAAMANKKIKLETWGPCAADGGWGTEVQSIIVQF